MLPRSSASRSPHEQAHREEVQVNKPPFVVAFSSLLLLVPSLFFVFFFFFFFFFVFFFVFFFILFFLPRRNERSEVCDCGIKREHLLLCQHASLRGSAIAVVLLRDCPHK